MFGAPSGTELTRPPRGFSTDEIYLPYIIKKQHLIYRHISDEELMSKDITERFAECVKIAYPRIDFLRNAVDT
jgi:uncharacterized protein (DUF2461 family)